MSATLDPIRRVAGLNKLSLYAEGRRQYEHQRRADAGAAGRRDTSTASEGLGDQLDNDEREHRAGRERNENESSSLICSTAR